MGSFASGRRGIPLEKADRIKVLLARDWRKADIAREVRVARCTVFRIAAKTHWSCRDDAPRLARCRICGHKVRLPCRECEGKSDGQPVE